ncbi:MAG: hypothetical protein JWM82_2723 [Myxococcales bacterium]|nr:hypothetical protein [Myxococcales bacterium]
MSTERTTQLDAHAFGGVVPIPVIMPLTTIPAVRIVLAVALTLSLASISSRAAGAEDIEGLIRQGIALRKAGDDSRAQGYFRRAYDLAKTPRSAAQLGLVEFALQAWVPSESHLSEALRAEDDSWIESNRVTLNRALDDVRSHLGGLAISGTPAGAHIKVAGLDRGALPLASPIYVTPGPVIVGVSADGYGSLQRRVDARVAHVEPVDIRLLPLTAPDKAPAAQPVPAPTAPPSSPSGRLRPLAWGIAAGSATLFAVGGVSLVLSNQNYTDFNNRLTPKTTTPMCDRGLSDRGGSQCQKLLADGDRDKVLAIVGFVAGGALAIGSAILFVMSPRDSSPSATAVSCIPNLQVAAGATCAVRF